MGNKAFKWFRSLLGSKKSAPRSSHAPPWKDRKNGDDPMASPYVAQGLDANKHAIAVAAATAAVAEAALAAAQAAAEVVRLTSGGGGRVVERRRVEAAVRIQAAFRAYLARRALRALKALVKLQALVRGHIVRKQSADMLRRMQAMARIQARASACRSYTTNPSLQTHVRSSSSKSLNLGTVNPKTFDNPFQNPKHGGYKSTLKQYNPRPHTGNITKNEKSQLASNWLDHWMQQTRNNDTLLQTNLITEDQRSDKILEIDTWKPRQNAKKKDSSPSSSHVASQYFSAWNDMGHEHSRISDKTQKPNPSVSSEEVSSVIIPPEEADQVAYWTAENSPRVRSASSRQTSNNSRAPFTPARSEYSRSVYGDYISHPNYMANTESSRAKVRSQSAPKQRLRLEELGVSLNSDRGFWDSDTYSEKGFALPGNYKSSSANVNSSYVRKQGTSTRRGGFSPTKR